MTGPITSKYQTNAWQPTVDTSDQNQVNAGNDYTKVYGGTVNTTSSTSDGGSSSTTDNIPYYALPHLSIPDTYTSAPDFVPVDGSSGGSANPSTALEGGRFSVKLAELRAAETTCISATHTCIDGYGTLETKVINSIVNDSTFGQNVGTWSHPGGAAQHAGATSSWTPDPYDDEAKQFADAITPQMKELLKSCAGVIEAMGGFTALLNNAGQMYTNGDYNSAFSESAPTRPTGS